MIPDWLKTARVMATSQTWKHGRPYFRSAAMALAPVPVPGLGTMAIDAHWRLYYDPSLDRRWKLEEIAGAILHEIEHLLRNHPQRLGGRNPRIFNIATDCEINDDLWKEGIPLPSSIFLPQKLGLPEGLTAEEYYERLLQFQASSLQSLQEASEGEGADPLQGRDGSGGGGRPGPWELPLDHPEHPGISQAQGELLRRRVAREVMEAAKGRGNLPGYLQRWAREILEPRVDWRKELRTTIRRGVERVAGRIDYSFYRPSRRDASPFILPGTTAYRPRLAAVVDTSGSMDDGLLGQALAEVKAILKEASRGQGLPVLAVDSALQAVSRVFRPEDIRLAGGGGTDMGVGLEEALKLRPRPEVVVVLTDGLTPWPRNPPKGVEVVVVLLGEGSAPGWARVIRVGEGIVEEAEEEEED